MKFHEIERKYLFNEESCRQRFFEKIKMLPGYADAETYSTQSRDRYLVVPAGLPYIYRFRYDTGLQQLTAKSLRDTLPVREEITLKLDPQLSQLDAVEALFATLGVAWQGELTKELTVTKFRDCEVVIYCARLGTHTLNCIEIEALGARDIAEGLAIIERYQTALDVRSYSTETTSSLFHHLIYPQLSGELQKKLSVFTHEGTYT
jgi:hypothetical protein